MKIDNDNRGDVLVFIDDRILDFRIEESLNEAFDESMHFFEIGEGWKYKIVLSSTKKIYLQDENVTVRKIRIFESMEYRLSIAEKRYCIV